MFLVSESDAAAIRTAFDQSAEFAAGVEVRRPIPAITDNVEAREYARTISRRTPLMVPTQPARVMTTDWQPLDFDSEAASGGKKCRDTQETKPARSLTWPPA